MLSRSRGEGKPPRWKRRSDRVRQVGGLIEPHICDVTDGVSVAAIVDAYCRHFGRIDILVNNVGGSAAGGPVELSKQLGQVDYNLKSVFLTCKHILPIMETQRMRMSSLFFI
jgi:NAD(P)-dependent dehydrogenase (short-subunit alcohol dehydrogenase family)